MHKFKAINIILLALSLAVLTGPQVTSSQLNQGDTDTQHNLSLSPSELQANNEYTNWFWDTVDWFVKNFFMIDLLPYWMPLNEGNTKTFRSTSSQSEEPIEYTKTVRGTDVVKGVEAVKIVVTESNIPFGYLSQGTYDSLLPDLSQGKTTLKKYYGKDPVWGSYYTIPTPFQTVSRYGYLIPGMSVSATSSSTCFKEDKTPVDSLITIVTITFLGFEDVTVPAGTFKDCLKYRIVVALNYAQTPENNHSLKVITWSAKGLGEVKKETLEMMFANELDEFPYNTIMKGIVHELISATVDGVSYPQDGLVPKLMVF